MKKAEQNKINEKVLFVYDSTKEERENLWRYPSRQLHYCSARVYEGKTGYFLKSYATVIAYIPYENWDIHPVYENIINKPCYDFLRYVYGYTATSAQHISKFAGDYHCGEILRYYAL